MNRLVTWPVCLVVGVLALGTDTVSGQGADPRIGRWQLNLAKSKFAPTATAPKAQNRIYEDRGAGIVLSTITTTPASGAVTVAFVLYKLDHKDYPQVPRAAETTTTITQWLVDANTVELVQKRDGKVLAGFTQVISADGKTLTYTAKDAQGQPTGTVQIFDKQGTT
jgi:hypothetical protein